MESLYNVFIIILSLILSLFYVIFILRRNRRYESIWSVLKKPQYIAILITATAAVMTTMTIIVTNSNSDLFKDKTEINSMKINYLLMRQDSLNNTIKNYENIFSELKKSDTIHTNANYDLKFAELNNELGYVKSSVNKFEGLLITDAEKIITLPLLKKEVEGLRIEINNLSGNIHSQNTLIKDIQSQTWSLVGILGLGILALIIPLIKGTIKTSGKSSENEK